MGSLWGPYGVFIGLRGVYRVVMGPLWGLYRVKGGFIGSLWGPYGVLMGSLWVPKGSYGLRGFLWGSYGAAFLQRPLAAVQRIAAPIGTP